MSNLAELFEEFATVGPGRELRQRILADAESVFASRDEGGRRRPAPGRRAVGWTLAAAGVVAVLVLLAAAAHSRHEPNRIGEAPPAQVVILDPARVDVHTRITGGSANLQAALKASLAGIGPTRIRRVTVSRAAHTYRPYDPHGVALTFDYPHHRLARFDPGQGYGVWQTGLVAAATRDRMFDRGPERVIYLENGLDDSAIVTRHLTPQLSDAPSPRQLVNQAQRAANQAGVTMTRITILHPRGLAVAVSLTATNPAHFLRHRLQSFIQHAFPKPTSPWGSPPTPIDGYYVELHNGPRVLVAQEANYRTQESGMWAIRPLFGCFPGIAYDLAHPNLHLLSGVTNGVAKCPAN